MPMGQAATVAVTHFDCAVLEEDIQALTRYATQDTLTLRILDTGTLLVPRHANRPPAISLRKNHLFRIRGLAQSRLRMGQEHYPSVRYSCAR